MKKNTRHQSVGVRYLEQLIKKTSYVLVKGKGDNLRETFDSQLNEACLELEFDTNSTAALSEDENRCS